MHTLTDFGAVGDGVTLDTLATQKAIDACGRAGGGTVIVPAGKTFLIGTIQMRSHVHLHIEGGATLLSATQRENFPNDDLRCMIEAREAHNISFSGTGTIDGRALAFMVEDLKYIFRGSNWRPRLIGLVGCHGVTFRDVTLKNAANWGLHMTGCQDVLITGIRILNDLKVPNCDGIDPDHCRNVRISDCHIQAGDDCIVIKNTKEFAHFGPSENIVVNNCTLMSTSAAIKIGTESVSDFRRITVNNCVIQGSSRGLAIQLRDQGNVEHVSFANCIVETRLFEDHWWGKAEPIYVTALHRFGIDANPADIPAWNARNELGTVRHVTFSNIRCRSENGVFIAGARPQSTLPGPSPSRKSPPVGEGAAPTATEEADCQSSIDLDAYHIRDIVLDNVVVEVDKWTKWPGGVHDRRPCDKLGPAFRDPSQDPGLIKHDTAGVFIEHAAEVTLRNVRVKWGKNRPAYFKELVQTEDVPGLRKIGLVENEIATGQ